MSHAQHVTSIREFFATSSPNECFTAPEIASALNIPELVISAALAHMVKDELALTAFMAGKKVYTRSGAFVARHITPLFAGTPEWIVETYEGRLVCWCPTEFDAKIIADAMKRS